MKGRWPLHPIFFATYPVVLLYALNADQVKLKDLALCGAASLGVAAVLMALAWPAARRARKAAAVTSLLLFYFYYFQGAYTAIHLPHIPYAVTDGALMALYLAALAAAAWWLWRTRSDLCNLTRILNATGGFLLATSLLPLAAPSPASAPIRPAAHNPPPAQKIAARGRLPYLPDIYFIILDQYPRTDTLINTFHCDNSWFLNSLRQLGFYVVERSASNYPRTAMSIGSTLNMNYLDTLMGPVPPACQDLGLPSKIIAHNAVFAYVRARGYKTVYLPPEYGAGTPMEVDVQLESSRRLTEFQTVLLGMTPIESITEIFSGRLTPTEFHRKYVWYELEQLSKLPHAKLSPMLVYAHIICPHPPICFGAKGERVDALPLDEPRWRWADDPAVQRAYADQVKYISSLALDLVKEIITTSPRPPVICLCSDHGTEFEVDWSHPEKSNLQERMANLQTYYFPDGGDKLLYPTMTNVNIFRIVFDYYLGGDFGLLPDRSYFSPEDTPYQYLRVPMDGPVIRRPVE